MLSVPSSKINKKKSSPKTERRKMLQNKKRSTILSLITETTRDISRAKEGKKSMSMRRTTGCLRNLATSEIRSSTESKSTRLNKKRSIPSRKKAIRLPRTKHRMLIKRRRMKPKRIGKKSPKTRQA